MSGGIPVTLIGGFLGAGKTSLLHHVISNYQGGYLAVLVENPGPLNLDAKAIRGLCGAMRRTNDAVFEIPEGEADAQATAIGNCLRELASTGRYERVLIELAGTTNPVWLARQFDSFADFAELQQIICVVDALDQYRPGLGPAALRQLSNLQFEQIASATTVVLNKCDLLQERELDLCRKQLSWAAHLAETVYGEVPLDILLRPASATELKWSLERTPPNWAGGIQALPLCSAVYRTYRPFHPQRFWDWFNADHPGLLRVKGLIWLATRNLLVGGVSRSRWQNSCGAAGIWWTALPREEWPQEPEALMRMEETWREPYGDRRQELVLIGDPDALATTMRAGLDVCLLTDEEYARPVKEWGNFPDPFPAWDFEES